MLFYLKCYETQVIYHNKKYITLEKNRCRKIFK